MSNNLLNVGDKAPEFTLPSSNGDNVSLNNLKGKNTIIWFFPKASTPGWTVEGQGFREEFNIFKELGYQILGVSADSIKRQKNFVDKYNFPFMMLCDESHEMLKNYKVWALKKFMGREYMGILRVTYIIDKDGIITRVYDRVKTKTHSQDILSDLSK